MMDRVRVVGINEPVRLYELVDEKSETPDSVREALDIFHSGLEAFENKEWSAALDLFNKVMEILPEDGPSNVYIKRCKDFMKKEPPASWDGVFNLTLK
jgi:adenylate cyclase